MSKGYPRFESEFEMLKRLQLQHPIETLEPVRHRAQIIECHDNPSDPRDEKVGRYIVN